MDIAKSETFKNIMVLNKVLLFLIKYPSCYRSFRIKASTQWNLITRVAKPEVKTARKIKVPDLVVRMMWKLVYT